MKINLQMYSFMDGVHNDSKENLKAAAEMGYDGVELFGPNFEIPAEEMKSLLAELGLEAVSMHAPNTDAVEGMIPYAVEVGLPYIGIGMEVMKDDDEVHAYAKRLNEIGEKCSEKGLKLFYHNHTQEFAPCGEERIYDTLMKETNPEYVSFELDAGWCAAAGVNPLDILKTYAGRILLVHIKESSKVIGPQPQMDFDAIPKDEEGRPIFSDEMKKEMEETKKINCAAGEGIVDWKALYQVAEEVGCKGYIVEREYSGEQDRVEVLKQDIDMYRRIIS